MTTVAKPSDAYAANSMNRHFAHEGTNELRISDMAYLRIGSDSNYLSCARDEGPSRVLGQKLTDHMRTVIVAAALDQVEACFARCTGTILQADQGSQFDDHGEKYLYDKFKTTHLIGATGSCYDQASAKRFWFILMHEYKYQRAVWTMEEMRWCRQVPRLLLPQASLREGPRCQPNSLRVVGGSRAQLA